MGFLYEIGPTLMGVVAALLITGYCWSRVRLASLLVMVWVSAAAVLGQMTIFPGFPNWRESDWQGFGLFGVLAFTPAALLVLTLVRSKKMRGALELIPTSALVMTQVYRFGGLFLIVAYLDGQLPVEVGLVSGVLDTIVATMSIVLGVSLRRNEASALRLVAAWSVLSLADFGWALLLISASFLGLANLSPAPVMMGNPPLLIISLFAMPLGVFVSVYAMLRATRWAPR